MQRFRSMFLWFVHDFIRIAAALALVAALPICAGAAARNETETGLATAPAVSGGRVTFAGEIGRPGPKADIVAKAGTRMGVEIIPEGSPAGAPVALTVRILRPEGLTPLVFQTAATLNASALCAYEFAYDWEAVPGVWTIKIFYDAKELASEDFTVVQTPGGANALPGALSAQAGQPGQTGQPAQPPVASTVPTAAPEDVKPVEAAPRADKPAQAAPSTALSGKAAPWTAAPRSGSKKGADQKQAAEKSPGQKTMDKSSDQKTPAGKSAGPKPLVKPYAPQETSARANPDQRKFVLINGVYSQENRALRVAAQLKTQGVKACVRKSVNAGKPMWSVVTGRHDPYEQALDAKRKLAPKTGENRVVPMTAGELEKGLICP